MREHLGLHDVDARVHGVREDLTPGRLLQEPLDPAAVVGDHDAELERVGNRFQRDGDHRLAFAVERDERGEVDVGQRIATDHDERLAGECFLGVLDAARGAQRRLLGRVRQFHAELFAVAEVVTDQRGEELHSDHGFGDAVLTQQTEDVSHDRLVDDRQQRLGLIRRHRAQSRALAPGHHDGPHETTFRAPIRRLIWSR